MKSDSNTSGNQISTGSVALKRVLEKNETIKEKVEESASELGEINTVLKQEKRDGPSVRVMEKALSQSEEVEHKVAEAADELHDVNTELAQEVIHRKVVEYELAKAKANLSETREELSRTQAEKEKARHRAMHDIVTGLPNRALFEQRLDYGLSLAKRHGWKLAVLFIDIDQFKQINDTHGHQMGDKVLLEVAKCLQQTVRVEDTVSRLGGDEFICLLLDVKREGNVLHHVDTMVHRISQIREIDGVALTVNVSIGIAIYPDDGATAQALFQNADAAMYKVKGTDRRVAFFGDSQARM